MDTIETKEHRGFTVSVHRDPDGGSYLESPLDPCRWGEGECLTVFRHRRYDFDGVDPFDGADVTPRRVRAYGRKFGYDVFPVYMLDHSGLAFRLGSTDPFAHVYMGMDSGLLGFLLLKREGWAKDRTTERVAESILDELTAWSNGWVYGYTVEDTNGETVDSCWGFVGLETDDCMAEGVRAADHFADVRDADAARAPHVHRARCIAAEV